LIQTNQAGWLDFCLAILQTGERKMNCPHCNKPVKIPVHAQRNMDSYDNPCNVVANCCGNLIHCWPVHAYGVRKAQESITVDDWGQPKGKIYKD
jgi:hypothetical protein